MWKIHSDYNKSNQINQMNHSSDNVYDYMINYDDVGYTFTLKSE